MSVKGDGEVVWVATDVWVERGGWKAMLRWGLKHSFLSYP